MKKRTRSILEELNDFHGKRNSDYAIDTTGGNLIESSINFLTRIYDTYDKDTALDLERRFFNSIRTGDAQKFKRSMNE
jgi:hypothetical protein